MTDALVAMEERLFTTELGPLMDGILPGAVPKSLWQFR
ncbi:hypothetical protein VULLAG_LOCUS14406 [Vulpes lagopus]